ncbi:pyrroline-5-carboxylate reductase [Clostridium collagenovorans DSM 3089]|uniref:Pyrroline-5-carboxylate reductase n=1 Tax=Clostridium collagenovorans DSM 3089 TaxID=1121306 RepID=A0A1M5TEV5_9CLOT|nr:pyrroline-5-carboxylate reductase dimerization domain-containing protein [Clostridium collagenovorans]SHH49287.1 pyrroline-5-carboxylate reductase [Clostridium collagenovorans DSM 3089]
MNNNVGFIGIGSMGSMMVNQFLESGDLKQENVYLSNRSQEKLENFKVKYPNINCCKSNKEVAAACSRIIIAVEPLNVPEVIKEIREVLNEESYLIISTATIAFEDLYKIYYGSMTKFMPTLNSRVRSGVSLICHNNVVSKENSQFFEKLMGSISEVKLIKEEDINLCHNLTGCMPAFIAEILSKFLKAANKFSINLTEEEMEHIIMQSVYGTSKLFVENDMKLEETIKGVSTKGGITYEGIQVLEEKLPQVFEEVLKRTTDKYTTITQKGEDIVNNMEL